MESELAEARARIAELERELASTRSAPGFKAPDPLRQWATLDMALSHTPDFTYTFDLAGRFTYVNRALLSLWQKTLEEAVGKDFFELGYPPDLAERLQRQIRQVIETRRPVRDRTAFTGPTGETRRYEYIFVPVLGTANQVESVVGSTRDVTERELMEEALRESEERFSLAFAKAPVGMVLTTPDGRIVEINQAYVEMLGYSREELETHDSAFFTHAQDIGPTREFFAALQAGPQASRVIEKRYIRKNGELLWARASGTMRRDEQGRPVQLIAIIEDITERKRVEAALSENKARLLAFLEQLPVGAGLTDVEGNWVVSNTMLRQMVEGRIPSRDSQYDVQWRAWRADGSVLDPSQYPGARALRGETVASIDFLRTAENEAESWMRVSGAPFRNATGEVAGAICVIQDIDRQKRTEDERRKSDERLAFALDAGGGVGTWDWDVAADRVYCDARFAQLFSVDPERAKTGPPVSEFIEAIHPDDREAAQRTIRTAVETGGDFAEEYRIVLRDGSVRCIYARGRCHRDDQGHATRFPGVVFDITERKQAEGQLRESQARLRAIYDGTYEYIGLLAPDGTLLEANRASLEFADNTRADVVGRLLWDTPWFNATPGAPEAVRAAVSRAAAGEFIRFESTIQRPNGEWLTFDLSLHPIRNEKGDVVLIVPEGRNITERKAAEEDLHQSNRELTRANRELEEFAYVASHDLQEPLRMVNIYTQLLLKRGVPDDRESQEYAEFIRQGVHRMEGLIKDLLVYSRVVHPEQERTRPADLERSLDQALEVLRMQIEDAAAVIVRSPLPRVLGDEQQLGLVFQNLVSNALKYRQADSVPRIEIEAVAKGGEWVISVKDNGIGFDARHAERIFGLFRRLHKDAYPGTGLGLAICKRIVERYGGKIWAESEGDRQGSVFHFSLHSAAK